MTWERLAPLILTVLSAGSFALVTMTQRSDHARIDALYACFDEKAYYVDGFHVDMFRQCLDDWRER